MVPYFFSSRTFFLLGLSLSILQPATSQRISKKILEGFTAEKFQSHINFLASDALLGRNTPSPGLDSAAVYIAAHFKNYGLQPVNGSYFEPVPLISSTLGEDNHVSISHNGMKKELIIKTEFVPFEMTASETVDGSLVFAGYGISTPENNYDDYNGVDVKGKIVLVMRHGPREEDSSSAFYNRGRNKYSSIDYKVENAIEHGAVGIIIVTDPVNHIMLTPRGYPWPSLSKSGPRDAVSISLKDDRKKKIPVIHVGKEVMELLFGSVDSLKTIQSRIDNEMKPHSFFLDDTKVHLTTSVLETPVKSNNVVGFLPGSDPVLKNEILVVGGHYDHVGYQKSHKDGEDYIFNGADDNASGTTGVLMVAEGFSKMKKKPARSILFITFSGEELGLYGSRTYVENPLFPLDKTVAMLNMDMISRNGADTLYLEGAVLSPDLSGIVEKANEDIGFRLQLGQEKYIDGSDHASFYGKKIPFVFFFAGLHPDYHTVRDNPTTINQAKAARIAQLVFKTSCIIANEGNRYRLIEKK
jgi:aminopeptidase YwaD